MADVLASSSPSSTTLDQVERFLREMVEQFVPEPEQTGPRAPRVLPALCLWTGLIVCVLRGMRYQRDLWRLLHHGGLWDYPRFAITDEAVYDRLERGGTAPLLNLLTQVSALLAARLAPYAATDLAPFASAVVAIDETTLDRVARRLPALRGTAPRERLAGTLAGVFDLRLQQWRTVAYRTNWEQNEKVLARSLLADLPPGSLILADLGYFAFAWFDDLTAAGHHWISRVRAKTSMTPIHTFYEDEAAGVRDQLVFLGAYRADRAEQAVRVVQFRVGSTTYRYLTNVTDPRQLPIAEIARLYARRWGIELAINLVKTHLGLHLLWSAKPVVIEQQVLAALVIAQCVQALRVEIAGRAGVDLFEVSLPLLVRYLPQFARRGIDPVEAFLLNAREVGFIRPSSRTVTQVPPISLHHYRPPPPDLVRTRTPRHANRKCASRHD
jgi:Transposase DDE domain